MRTFVFAIQMKYCPFSIVQSNTFAWTRQAVWMMLSRCVFPFLQTFGFRLQLRDQLLVIPFTAVTAVFQSKARCSVVCNANPIYYGLKYLSSREIFASLHSLMIFGPHVFQNSPTETNCIKDCELVRAFPILFVGFLIPTLILAALEETSRLEVLSWYGGTPFYQSSVGNLFYSFLMLPFFAVIIFELVFLFKSAT